MNHAPSQIIAKRIIDVRLGMLPPFVEGMTFPTYYGVLPERPDDAIVVIDTTSIPDGRLMRGGRQIEHPGIQVRVRAGKYATAYARLMAIARMFDAMKRTHIVVDSTAYRVDNVSRRGRPIPLGPDETNRQHFTLNAVLTIAET